jgi:glycosyltransferase involved in cell wall biosynthesis
VFTGGVGPVTERLAAAGVAFRPLRHLRRSIHPVLDFRAAAELTEALADYRPDLVSLHTAKAGWLGRLISPKLRLPAIYTPHGWPSGGRFSAGAGFAFRVAERLMANRAAAIVCVCNAEKEIALRQHLAPAHRLRVIHNGVHDIAPEHRADPRREPVRIVSVARFQAPKDHANLVRALAMIRSQQWQLDLVGDGPLEPQLRELAGSLGVGSQVRFLGYQPDPAPILAGAQIFALSSRSEGLPRSVLEAMRAGLAVVASRVGGVPEAVADGVSGLLVEPGDAAGLASALRGLIGDASLRHRLGIEARRTYERCFRFERTAQQTLALYRELS